MHLTKFKSNDAVGLFSEATRATDEAGNFKSKTCYEDHHVDPSRSALNYDLVGRPDPLAYYRRRLQEVKIAKKSADLNTFSSSVVYLPTEYLSLSEDKKKQFFKAISDYFEKHYGRDNYIYAIVHNDENRPHVHCVGIPVEHRERRVTKTGRVREEGDYLNADKVDSRSFVSSLHDNLDKHLRSTLAWYHGGIQAQDEEERATSSLVVGEYRKYKDLENKVDSATKDLEAVRSKKQKYVDYVGEVKLWARNVKAQVGEERAEVARQKAEVEARERQVKAREQQVEARERQVEIQETKINKIKTACLKFARFVAKVGVNLLFATPQALNKEGLTLYDRMNVAFSQVKSLADEFLVEAGDYPSHGPDSTGSAKRLLQQDQTTTRGSRGGR